MPIPSEVKGHPHDCFLFVWQLLPLQLRAIKFQLVFISIIIKSFEIVRLS